VSPKHFTSLNLCAFIQRNPGDEFPATHTAYQNAAAAFGPDDLFAIMSWLNAYLEDYTCLVDGLISLYEASGELTWIESAISLADKMIEQFWDEVNGGFFFTGKSHEELIVRSKDFLDNATPSGNSVAVLVLLKLAEFTGNEDYQRRAMTMLRLLANQMRRYPSAFGYALCGLDFYLSTPKEIALVGNPDDDRAAIARTFDYARRLGLDFPIVQCLTPYPRTEMRAELLAEGLVTNPDDLSRYNGYMANVRTRHLSSEAIARAMLWEGLKLYFDPRAARRSRFFHDFPAFRGAMLRNSLALFSGIGNRLFQSTHTL